MFDECSYLEHSSRPSACERRTRNVACGTSPPLSLKSGSSTHAKTPSLPTKKFSSTSGNCRTHSLNGALGFVYGLGYGIYGSMEYGI